MELAHCTCLYENDHFKEILFTGFLLGYMSSIIVSFCLDVSRRNRLEDDDEEFEDESCEENIDDEEFEENAPEEHTQPVVSAADQELFEMFQEEVANHPDQITLRQEIEKPPVELPPPSFGTKYISSEALKRRNDEFREKSQSLVLSRSEELDIIDRFRTFESVNYKLVKETLEMTGYAIHPIYVNDGPKMVRSNYSNKVIGVRVKDPKYTGTEFSDKAVVSDIIDVGGQDNYNRGRVFVRRS